MDTYKDFVRNLAFNNISAEFLNSDENHALIVFDNLFKIAKNYVYIFAGCLCSDVSNKPEYIKSLSDFIENKGEVRILLNSYNPQDAMQSQIIKRIAFYISKKYDVKVYSTDRKIFFSKDEEKKQIHFTVVDDKSYRIETDVKERSATCNYNNPNMALNLKSIFLEVMDSSTEIDVLKLFAI